MEKPCKIKIVPSETTQCVSWHSFNYQNLRFESRVVLDGNQTDFVKDIFETLFESRVVLDGNQTMRSPEYTVYWFESRVVLDGNQTTLPVLRE